MATKYLCYTHDGAALGHVRLRRVQDVAALLNAKDGPYRNTTMPFDLATRERESAIAGAVMLSGGALRLGTGRPAEGS